MNGFYLVGMLCGIVAAIIVAVLITQFGKKFENKNLPAEYDERQKLARGKAFQAGFFTLLIYNGICYLLEFMEIDWCEPGNAIVLGIFLAVTVFAVTAIRADAYMRLNENLKSSVLLWVVLLVCNGVTTGLNIASGDLLRYQDGRLSGNWVNALCCAMAAVILGVQLAHSWRLKREERADLDA